MTAFVDPESVHPELRSLFGDPRPVGRRDFIVTTLGAGFAAAVLPVSAQTITTSSEGLIAGEVKVPVRDGEIPAYRAMPASGNSFPTILVVQEVFGVHEWIKDVCRRLAKMGYYAIAPELYARQGDPTKISDTNQLMKDIVSKVPDAQVLSDLDAAAAYAKSAGKTIEIVVYPDTPHGFLADYRPSYRKEAAEEGWKRMSAWFDRYLGGADRQARTPRQGPA